MQNVILAINPGRTTTRCALYAVKSDGLSDKVFTPVN